MKFLKKNVDTKDNLNKDSNNTKSKTMVNLIKTRGKFINVYDIDAYIMSLLFNYKVLDGKKAGFPESNLEKVKAKLDENSINYQVTFPDSDPIIKKFDNNRYNEFKEKAISNMNYKVKVEKICDYIKNATDEQVENILSILEKECIK